MQRTLFMFALLFGTAHAFNNGIVLQNATNYNCTLTANNGTQCRTGYYYDGTPQACCGCCTGGSSCQGNDNSPICCPSSTCGCLNDQAGCGGYVYNNTESSANVQGYNSFGVCFESGTAVCGADVLNEVWILCPLNYDPCPGPSFGTCCQPGTSCNKTASTRANYPICSPTPPSSSSSTSSTSKTSILGTLTSILGGLDQANVDTSAGSAAILSPPAGKTLVAGQTYTFTYRSATTPPGNVYIAYLGQSLISDGAFPDEGTNPVVSFNYTIRADQPMGPTNFTFIEERNNGSPFTNHNTVTSQIFYVLNEQSAPSTTSASNGAAATVNTADCLPNGCAGGALCCAGQCYSTGQYTCFTTSNGYQLCPLGLQACGKACYNPSTYACSASEGLSLL